jgi:hypothetical protein
VKKPVSKFAFQMQPAALRRGDWSPNQESVGNTRWKCQMSGDGWAVWEDERYCD